jgi:hypothetical protein
VYVVALARARQRPGLGALSGGRVRTHGHRSPWRRTSVDASVWMPLNRGVIKLPTCHSQSDRHLTTLITLWREFGRAGLLPQAVPALSANTRPSSAEIHGEQARRDRPMAG